MRYLNGLVVGCFLLPVSGWAGEKDVGGASANSVAPFVDDMTTVVGHLDAKRFDVASFFKFIEELGSKDKEFAGAKDVLTSAAAFWRWGGRDVFVLLNWDACAPG